jgi:hypothetical protein
MRFLLGLSTPFLKFEQLDRYRLSLLDTQPE